MIIQNNLFRFFLLFVIIAPAAAFAGTSGPSPIPTPPNFQMSTNTVTLCKGMINSVQIQIKTPVGAALMQNTQLNLINSKSAYTVGNGTINMINVSANVTKVITLPIFVSLNASSLISTGIQINYQYYMLYTDSEIRNISFGTEACANPLSIGIYPAIFTSGKIQNIVLNLTNTGNTQLNYVSMRASIPVLDGTFLGIQPIQISKIAPRSSVQLNQSVFIYKNATQSFPVNFSVTLYNGSSLEQIAYNPVVLSAGIINITPSSITLSPQKPTPGGIFSISFVLTDVGTTGASAVTATALTAQGFTPYGSSSTFVGDMPVDTQTPVTLTLTAGSSIVSGNYTIPIRINYLDNLRENHSTLVEVPVSIAAATSFNAIAAASKFSGNKSNSYGLAITLVLIIIILVLAYMLHKERKHRSK